MSKKNKSKKKKKAEKEKVVYYDDNSTIADMSNVSGVGRRAPAEKPPKSSAKEKWATYRAAVKRMLLPMFVVIFVLAIIFGVMLAISMCAA